MSQRKWRRYSLFILCLFIAPAVSVAADVKTYVPTANMMGELGLNTVPSARMAPEGSARFTLSRQSPYTHAALGFQLTDRLYLGVRQTSESENFNSETLHLYPGMDLKLMLYDERRFIPQISVGLQSAFGHKRFSGEYLVMSKRYEDFDFTFGFGWGRLGSRMSLPNPILLNTFQNKSRQLDGENPNTPKDWFKGDMGVFGGVEYTTPINGLNLKADWNSDGWKAEKSAITNFKAPAPWSIGLSYKPLSWVDTGLSYSGQDVIARVTFTGNVSDWKFDNAPLMPFIAMKPNRPDISSPTNDENSDDDDDFNQSIHTERNLGLTQIFITDKVAEAQLNIDENFPTPEILGNAARYLSNISGATPEKITLHLNHNGLKGISVSVNRPDLERLFLKRNGSPEEIWQNIQFTHDENDDGLGHRLSKILSSRPSSKFKLDVINDVSLSEEDSGLLYRSGATFSYIKNFNRHFISYQSVRLNLSDNLEKLNEFRGVSFFPVRGDIDIFTQNRLMVERSYYMGLATLADDLHISSALGYLEEMYMGFSGEILYRPFEKNWAIGAEMALAFKRDPYSFSALAPNGDHILTGFINAYYEPFNSGITMKASAGRFLAGDIGGTVSISNEFLNGVTLSADISASNKSDPDIYGDKTNLFSGFRVSLPIGSTNYLPNGSKLIVNASPLGRDTSQRLDMPTSLYNATEPLSYRHITRHWQNIAHSK